MRLKKVRGTWDSGANALLEESMKFPWGTIPYGSVVEFVEGDEPRTDREILLSIEKILLNN